MSDDLLADLARHAKSTYTDARLCHFCRWCERRWPCDPARALDLIREMTALVRDLVDPDPCEYDHHGYCQAHGWTTDESVCPHRRARELLATLDQP